MEQHMRPVDWYFLVIAVIAMSGSVACCYFARNCAEIAARLARALERSAGSRR
jgi:hypothetical protein